jgi:hypothetical protein
MSGATLFDTATRSRLEGRIRTLQPDSRRQWGRMSPHEAVCHLSDAFRMALGEKACASVPGRFKPVLRFVALHLPLSWPRGIKTLPEVEQGAGAGGTPPVDFERDRRDLLALIARFCDARPEARSSTHPMFGPMSTAGWGRWGYRHLDHHLRQFGV